MDISRSSVWRSVKHDITILVGLVLKWAYC